MQTASEISTGDLSPANRALPIIKVVGVSASGKSTLVQGLRNAGYDARTISQEHSHIPDLWRQFESPSLLLYLDADLACQQRRRPGVTWTAENLNQERTRLAHAIAHADLHINTSQLDASVIFRIAEAFLAARQVRRHDQPLPPLPATGSAIISEPHTSPEFSQKQERQNKKGGPPAGASTP